MKEIKQNEVNESKDYSQVDIKMVVKNAILKEIKMAEVDIAMENEKLINKWIMQNKPKVKMNYCNDRNVNSESPKGYSKTQVWHLLEQGVCKKSNKDELLNAKNLRGII